MNENVINFINAFANAKAVEQTNREQLDKINKFIRDFMTVIEETGIYTTQNYTIYQELINVFYYWLNLQRKPWLKDKVVIAVMGKFSAGKSSIINSILGQNILPVDITPTTAIPTYISFRPVNKFSDNTFFVKVIDYADKIKEIDINIFKSIKKDDFKNFPLTSLIKYFVLEFDNKNLKEYSIIDTPGYDSVDDKDYKKALEVIRECDAVLWVTDIEDGELKKDALNFIKDNIKDKMLSFVINKADKKPPEERKRVLQNIELSLKKNSINYDKCFLYSTKNKEYEKLIYESIINMLTNKEKIDIKQIILTFFDDILEQISQQIFINKKQNSEIDMKIGILEREVENMLNEFQIRVSYLLSNIRYQIKPGIIYDTIKDIKTFRELMDKLDDYVKNFHYHSEVKIKLEELGKYRDQRATINELIKLYESYKLKIINLRNDFRFLI